MPLADRKLFLTPKPLASPKARLFCFPHAGGSASTFISWAKSFNSDIELVLVQLPGRASRMGEAAHESMDSLISELLENEGFITDLPYCVYGHSLGSRVAFELVCQLQHRGFSSPVCFIASGSRAPHLPAASQPVYNLPKDEFLRELSVLNGTPKEILENKELIDLLEPMLRADFKIADNYQSQLVRLACPMLILGGEQDAEVKRNQLDAWEQLSAGRFNLEMIPGDHFFINQSMDLVIRKIKSAIQGGFDV